VANYSNLTDINVFIHSHRTHRHGTKRDNRTVRGIDYDNVAAIRALNLEFVMKSGFANLRCLNSPGCPSEIQPFRPEAERDPLRPQEGAMPGAWHDLFLNDAVPRMIATPCCAQFAVSKSQILQRGKEEYNRYLIWLYATELNDATSGRVFEYLWHIIFGRAAIHCVDEVRCYKEQYRISEDVVREWVDGNEMGGMLGAG
jgi:hypothetical protein